MKYVTKIFVGSRRDVEPEINDWSEHIHPKYIVSTHTSSAVHEDGSGGCDNLITVVFVYWEGL